MESMEQQVGNEQWTNADVEVEKLDKKMKELISQVDSKKKELVHYGYPK